MLRVRALPGNRQWLDGGAMFGNLPRVVWEKYCRPDSHGRIELSCRALLVEDGERRVLLETGIGAFFEPKLRERYGIVEDDHVLLRSLSSAGLSDGDIDAVVLSHLHFDHAGGLLAPYVAGRPKALLFPNASFVVGRAAFERARNPHPRDRASFIPELPDLLERTGRLRLVEASGTGAADTLDHRYSFRESHGHTPGMLHTLLRGMNQCLFFCADLVPGVPWVHLPITMGYDRAPERLIDEKAALFEELLRARAWLFFTHDPRASAARLKHESGRYTATAEKGEGAQWDLDESESA